MYYGLKSKRLNETKTLLYGTYFDNGEAFEMTVETSDYKDWLGGKLVQNAFPYLNADQREALISGFSPDGFDAATKQYDDV